MHTRAILASSLVVVGIMLSAGRAHAADTFARNLGLGSKGADVVQLQQFLTAQHVYAGASDGRYASEVVTAVRRFQIMKGIVPASGYFGPLTRRKANEVAAGSQATATSSISVSFVNPSVVVSSHDNLLAISGNGFREGARVKINDTYLQTVGPVQSASMSVIMFAGFNPGVYDLTLVNPDGDSAAVREAITVRAALPAAGDSAGQSAVSVIDKVRASVTLVRTNLGCGSGMIVQNDGYVLTNYHVIKGASRITVYLSDGSVTDAQVAGQDETEDLALLKFPGRNLQAVTFANSSAVALPLDSPVTALGYPLTCNSDQTLAVESGTITARRTLGGMSYLGELLQTSARIHAGNSGGPLVNQSGEVIGINTLAVGIGGVNVSGIAFAIPSNTFRPLLTSELNLVEPQKTEAPPAVRTPGVVAGNGSREFIARGGGFCDNNAGASTVIVGDKPIPSSYIKAWDGTAGMVDFVVPETIAAGNYDLTVTGYKVGVGYCFPVHVGRLSVP